MICIAWLGIWFGISNTFGEVEWGRKKNRETDEEHNGYCVEEGFKLTRGNLTEMVKDVAKQLY